MFFKLPFYNPKITIKDFIDSLFLSEPKEKLQKYLQDYFNSKNILLLKSARQGIELIFKSLNLVEGDEVILPSFICPVVPEAVIRAKGKPVFCGIEKNEFNMDAESARELISPRTKAIIAAHIFGIPAEIEEFVELTEKNNIFLIEDCAQSFGAKHKEKLLGTFGDFAAFSFGISKNIGGIGGGFLLCKDTDDFKKIEEINLKLANSKFSFKKYLEFLLILLFLNKYFYWILGGIIEKYAKMKRDNTSEEEFILSISSLEAKVAFLKLRKNENNQKIRNKNAVLYQEELKSLFSFIQIPRDNYPAFPYLPVLSSQETFNMLMAKNIPVRKLEFMNEAEYFLLPLNYFSRQVKLICAQIKKILSKHGE